METQDTEKKASADYSAASSTVAASPTATPPNEKVEAERWNPMNESIWTRLGLSLESFKPAPGHSM